MNNWSNMWPLTSMMRHGKELIERLNTGATPILVTHKGRSVAVLVDLDTFHELELARRTRETYLSRSEDL